MDEKESQQKERIRPSQEFQTLHALIRDLSEDFKRRDEERIQQIRVLKIKVDDLLLRGEKIK